MRRLSAAAAATASDQGPLTSAPRALPDGGPIADHARMERIVVGVDGSEESRTALNWALDEARLHGASIEVVHVWYPPYAGNYPFAMPPYDTGELDKGAQALVAHMLETADTTGLAAPIETTIVCGAEAQVLLDRAEGAAMLVAGARGRGGFSRLLLGSVSTQLVAPRRVQSWSFAERAVCAHLTTRFTVLLPHSRKEDLHHVHVQAPGTRSPDRGSCAIRDDGRGVSTAPPRCRRLLPLTRRSPASCPGATYRPV